MELDCKVIIALNMADLLEKKGIEINVKKLEEKLAELEKNLLDNKKLEISEKDLELRGSGEFFGTRQHGIPEFKIANLFEDIGMLKSVQSVAMQIIEEDPKLEMEKNKVLKRMVDSKFGDRIEI